MGDRTAEVEHLRRLFRLFGATQCRGRSPVYQALSDGVAGHDDLPDLLLATPGDQRRPSLLFAAVNLLLASSPDSDLGAYYPIHGGSRLPDDQLWPAFSAFCAEHRMELSRLLADRSTQTNEIRRCVALRLGLDHVRRRWSEAVALVEIGASAGLNLLFDRYRYRLNGREQGPPPTGATPVAISCEVRGGASGDEILGIPPTITSRLGIDRHPIAPSDPGARAWLEAFIWPEQVEDLASLRGALDLAASTPIATVVPGEATTDTARLLADLPGGEPVVVFTASLLSYLTTSARTAFVDQLDEAAHHRPVAWVFAEGPSLLATTDVDVAALDGHLAQRNSHYVIGTSVRGPDGHDDVLHAVADPYLRWLAPAQGATDDFHWVIDEGG